MGDEHHIVAIGRKNTQRSIGDGHGRHDDAVFGADHQLLDKRKPDPK
jgi:hypothetical protein